MKKDKEIKAVLGRQLKKYRVKSLKKSPAQLAKIMKEDFPDDKIQRGTITNQEKSPSYSYIMWLYEKSHRTLNIEWLFAGEDDDSIPMIKI